MPESIYIKALEWCEELISTLNGINNGFEERGSLQRKFARSMFKMRAKMKIEEWIEYANNLLPKLKKLNEGDKSIIVEFAKLKEHLANLIKYHVKTAKLVQNFFEGDELADILEKLGNAERKVNSFLDVIKVIEAEN